MQEEVLWLLAMIVWDRVQYALLLLLLLLSLSRQGPYRRPSVTTVDSTPPEVCRRKVVICPDSGVDRPICYGDGLGGVATYCLVVDRAIGWRDSWVPCGLERRLAVWLHGQRGRYAGDWWSWRWMEGQLSTRRCLRYGWVGAIWFVAVAFNTSYERPRGLWNR